MATIRSTSLNTLLPSSTTGGASQRLKFGPFHFYVQSGHVCYTVSAYTDSRGWARCTGKLGGMPTVSNAPADQSERIARSATKAAGRAYARLLLAKIDTPDFSWVARKKAVRQNG